MSGDHLGRRPRDRPRARPDPAVRARRRRPQDRLERHRPDARPAGPRGRAGPPADRLAAPRPLPVDALRDGRPAQGRRGRGRRARRRPLRRPPRQSPRHRHVRCRSRERHAAEGRQRAGCSASSGPSPPNRPRRAAARPRRPAPSPSSARSGPRPGVVVIVSDFRGPRDWVPALTEVAGRHAVIALEITDPREESLVDVGELTLIDPETGRTLRVDTGDRRLRTAFDEAAAADRTSLAARVPAPRRPPPPTLHRRPVAPRARAGLHPNPRPNRTTRMNFLAPEMLLGLLLIPIAIGFYLWAQRRRSKYAVRFTNLALLSNIAPKRPSWRRHLPPVLYLGAIAALLIGLARPTMIVPVPREDATVILTMDVSGSMRATDVSPTRLDAARASAQSFIDQLPGERPRRDRRLRLRAGHARQPDHRPRPAQGRPRQPAPRATGRRWATRSCRSSTSPRRSRRTRRRDARRDRDAAADAASRGARRLGRPEAARSTSHRASRSSPRSCCPTAPTRSARPSRSRPPTGPRRSACRSTRSRSGPRTGPSTSATSSASCTRSTSRRTPRRSSRSPRPPAGKAFDAPTAEDLKSVYDNLQSRIGYTEERQEVTFALVAAGLLLVVVGAGLSAVWFGRLP